MLNHITIMGRLTKAPELRYTKTEKPVASFTLAVDRDGRDAGTDFIDCVAWDKTATFVDDYFSKGSMAVVDGRLQMRPWEDKNGNKRVSAEVVAHSVYFGESKKKGENTGYASYDSAPTCGSAFGDLTDAEGNLPF